MNEQKKMKINLEKEEEEGKVMEEERFTPCSLHLFNVEINYRCLGRKMFRRRSWRIHR